MVQCADVRGAGDTVMFTCKSTRPSLRSEYKLLTKGLTPSEFIQLRKAREEVRGVEGEEKGGRG